MTYRGWGWGTLALCVFFGACGDDSAPPDGATFCVSDTDCDDGVFCNGVERCDTTSASADMQGCVSVGSPCATGACDELTDTCTADCADADGDGVQDVACGGTDCDDSDPNVYTGATEVCDLDNVDEDCDPTTFGDRDLDDDGFIDARCCNGTACGEDCDETARGTNPTVPEVCDGRDNDCDGTVDEGLLQSVFVDADRDLHGDPMMSVMACPGRVGTSASMLDCDDTDPYVNSPQREFTDGRDNDCDGRIDESPMAVTWYPDTDGDGFGNAAGVTISSDTVQSGHSLLPFDCDDDDPARSPLAEEACNALDDDCDGRLDFVIGINDWEDDDGDGYPDAMCAGGSPRADCDDTDARTHPGALEICDFRDNDCDGRIDEGATNGCQSVTTAMGQYHTCALLNGQVKCWGANWFGQAGLGDTELRGDMPDEMGVNLDPVSLGSDREAVAIGAGQEHSCALLDDGSVKCWGDNEFGQLGLDDTDDRGDGPGEMGDDLPAVSLGQGAVAISVGWNHTCALLEDGSVKCWGNNEFGQLGQGDALPRGDQSGEMDALLSIDLGASAIAISAGWEHTCALLNGGLVKCWGGNEWGVLGLGDGEHRGDGPGEMGSTLPAVSLGGAAVAIFGGESHTCALLDDGSAKCWGLSVRGQLGLGSSDARGDEMGEMGEALPAIDLGSGRTAVSMSAALFNTCAVLDNATVKCWGDRQLGLGDMVGRGGRPREMGDNLPAVSLGSGRTAVAVSIGFGHACVSLDDGTIKCWGQNGFGQLGLGDMFSRGEEPGEMGDNLPAVEL